MYKRLSSTSDMPYKLIHVLISNACILNIFLPLSKQYKCVNDIPEYRDVLDLQTVT